MMLHALFDEWLFLEVNGNVGSYGKDEFIRNYKSTFKQATVACLHVQVKQLTIEPSMMPQKTTLMSQVFNDEYLVLQEWLSANVVQLMAVNKSKIEEIYEYFKPITPSALVPYQVALRAFLRSKDLLNDTKAVIVVDDIKTMAIVTIFSGSKFSDARHIAMRDMEYMAHEIKRTWSVYSAGSDKDMGYVLICNNKEWLSALIKLKLVSQDEVLHLDVAYPVLEGLKTAKFPHSFILPKDLARKKRHALFTQRLTYLGILMGGIFTCGGIWGTGMYLDHQAKAAQAFHQQKEQQIKQALALAYKTKLSAYLKSISYKNAEDIYLDLIQRLPYGFEVKEFNLNHVTDGAWDLNAMILPNVYEYQGDLMLHDIWQDAIVTNEKVNDQLGQRLRLALTKNDGSKDIQTMINVLMLLKDDVVLKSSLNYAAFMSRLKHDASTYGLKVNLEIVDIVTNDPVYLGMNAIKFKLSFYQVSSTSERVRILDLMNSWQEFYPIRITSIECKNALCQIIGGVYGV